MEYFDWFTKAFSSLSGLGFLIGVIVLWKTGLLEFLLNLKKNGNGKVGELEKDLKEVKENHLHEIKDRLTSIETKLDIIMRHLKL